MKIYNLLIYIYMYRDVFPLTDWHIIWYSPSSHSKEGFCRSSWEGSGHGPVTKGAWQTLVRFSKEQQHFSTSHGLWTEEFATCWVYKVCVESWTFKYTEYTCISTCIYMYVNVCIHTASHDTDEFLFTCSPVSYWRYIHVYQFVLYIYVLCVCVCGIKICFHIACSTIWSLVIYTK